jgi:hypothetical protein
MWPKGIYCNGHIMVDAEKMVCEGLIESVCLYGGRGGGGEVARLFMLGFICVRVLLFPTLSCFIFTSLFFPFL